MITGTASLVVALFLAAQPGGVEDVPLASLRGSPATMEEQHQAALAHGLPFFHTRAQIEEAVARGHLVALPGDENYEVADFVDPPYAHPAGLLFVERTAALYHQACGQPLVVTSAVRPIDEQPPNAHRLSVHPAGIAIDLRVSQEVACREFLENKLLALEQQGILNGIREFHPPHYHVAVYPEPYTAYVTAQRAAEEVLTEPIDPLREPFGWSGVLIFFLLLILGFGLISWHLQRRRSTPDPPDR